MAQNCRQPQKWRRPSELANLKYENNLKFKDNIRNVYDKRLSVFLCEVALQKIFAYSHGICRFALIFQIV